MPKTVSIVIPCRNEEQYISKCLDSIITTTFPKDRLEVLVCDGQSTDKSQQIVLSYCDDHPYIKLLNNEKQTTQYGLNLGIKNSNGDVVIILGAHAELYPDYIEKSLIVLGKDGEIGCAGGLIESVYENLTSEIISLAMSSRFGVGDAYFRTGEQEGFVDTVAFGAYKREVFEKIGFFDEDLVRNQDDEFNYRLTKAGYKIYLSKVIRSKYFVRGSFKKLFRQYYQYGYWKVFVSKKHKTITTLRQLVPLLFVLFLIFGVIMSLFNFYLLISFLGVFFIYFLLAFIFAFMQVKSMAKVLQVVWTFLILHVSYGLGYLEGVFKFVLLNQQISLGKTELTR
ncbi:MAG: succinoglycan biosynthesis protein exoa [Flavobacteriales bacterium]|nr:glycosyltransferase family 2 protein [Bacteroidales bacterium AH-315-I05]PCJ84663.1 MAG: succinoglycan biosynthesis protein exoa [Flavobacteriales bacterium]